MTSKFAKISKKRWWSPQFAINDFFCCFFLMLQIAQTTLSIIFLYVFMFILKRTWIKVFEICYTEYFENYVHQVTFFVESLRSQTPKEYFYNKETASNFINSTLQYLWKCYEGLFNPHLHPIPLRNVMALLQTCLASLSNWIFCSY